MINPEIENRKYHTVLLLLIETQLGSSTFSKKLDIDCCVVTGNEKI